MISTTAETTSREESSSDEREWNARNVDSSSSINNSQDDNFNLLLSPFIDSNEISGNDVLSELMGLNECNPENSDSTIYSDVSSDFSEATDRTIYSEITSDYDAIQKSINSHSYEQQLGEYRYNNHWKFLQLKREDTENTWNVDISNINRDISKIQNKYTINRIKEKIEQIEEKVPVVGNVHQWPKDTILIASDSMFNTIDEKRLSMYGKNVKVRSFKGSTISDMYFYLYPLLQKCPKYLLLH